MMVKIWIDDVRPLPNKEWIWCKSYKEGFNTIARRKDIKEISFDHDLGNVPAAGKEEKTGYDLLKFFLAMNKDNLNNIIIHVHSMNPVGRKRIVESLLWTFKPKTIKVFGIDLLNSYRERE